MDDFSLPGPLSLSLHSTRALLHCFKGRWTPHLWERTLCCNIKFWSRNTAIDCTAVQFVWLHWISIQWPGVDDEFSPRTPLIILSLPPPFQIHSPPLTQSLLCQSYQHQWLHTQLSTIRIHVIFICLHSNEILMEWEKSTVSPITSGLSHPTIHLQSFVLWYVLQNVFQKFYSEHFTRNN